MFSSNVFCSWHVFPGCYKCNSSKTNWDVPELFSISPHPTTRRCSRAICFFKFFLFVLMTLIASIIIFSKKTKKMEKKCYPRPSTWYTLDMERSTLDPRQKDRLNNTRQIKQAQETRVNTSLLENLI